jgi:hypothetical protein
MQRAFGRRASTSNGPVKSSWVTRGYSANTMSKVAFMAALGVDGADHARLACWPKCH